MRIIFDATSLTGWAPFDPIEVFHNGKPCGGTELQLMRIAEALGKRGHLVEVFCPCSNPGKLSAGVTYHESGEFLSYAQSWDSEVVVSFANPSSLTFNESLRTKLKVEFANYADVHWRMGYNEKFDIMFYMSEYQGALLERYIPKEKLLKVPAVGCKLNEYPGVKLFDERENAILYASSPDRGLDHFLEVATLIKKDDPEIKVHISYGDRLEGYIARNLYDNYAHGDKARRIQYFLRELGDSVVVHKGLSRKSFLELLSSVRALIYPCDPVAPSENYCMVISEANACGTPVIASGADCLEEIHGKHVHAMLPVDQLNLYADEYKRLQEERIWKAPSVKGVSCAVVRHTWDTVAKRWEAQFMSLLPKENAQVSITNTATEAVASFQEYTDHLTSGHLEAIYDLAYKVAESTPQEAIFAEVGTRAGGSALAIMQAMADANLDHRWLFTVDPYGMKPYLSGDDVVKMDYGEKHYRTAMEVLSRTAQELRVRHYHYRMTSADYINTINTIEFWSDGEKLKPYYGFVFLDGDHNDKVIAKEFEHFEARLDDNGIIVIDDARFVLDSTYPPMREIISRCTLTDDKLIFRKNADG